MPPITSGTKCPIGETQVKAQQTQHEQKKGNLGIAEQVLQLFTETHPGIVQLRSQGMEQVLPALFFHHRTIQLCKKIVEVFSQVIDYTRFEGVFSAEGQVFGDKLLGQLIGAPFGFCQIAQVLRQEGGGFVIGGGGALGSQLYRVGGADSGAG